MTVSATVGGQTQTATAYEVAAPDLTRSPGLRFTRTVAHATVVFPPAAPTTPTPLLGVSVLAETASGLTETHGLVTVGTPLRVRVRDDRAAAAQATSDLTVQGVTIGGEARSASRQADGTVLSDAPWTPTQVGAVTVTATALAPGGGVLTASVTLRVLAAGGSVNEPLPNDPPAVITALTLPKAGATGVPVTVYPQVTFTEPVTHVVEGVTLEQLAAEGDTVVATVPVTLLGVGLAGPVALDVNNAPTAAVTSLTIQPTVGLAYATRYRLRLGGSIVDTDTDVATGTPAPKALTAYATTFTTFGPEAIGQTEARFASPGIVLIDTRGYVATPEVSGLGSTQLRVYDVSDPVTPTEIVQETPRSYVGTPTVLVGEAVSALTGGPLVALGTARTQIPWGPSNLLLFDVQTDVPQWIGAVSVGTGPTDGILQQVVLRGTRAYAATVGLHKGLQVIDLAVARDLWAARLGGWLEGNPAYWSTLGELNTEGTGFGQAAIVRTVTVPTGTEDLSHLYALDVWDGVVDGQAQPLVVATGRTPLAVVNPQTGEILHNGPIPWADGATPAVTAWGAAIAVTHVADRDVAVLVTTAMPTARLVVIDLSDPAAPQVLSELALPDPTVGWKSGLLIKDGIVYLGGATNTTLVNLTDPLQPRLAGTIAGVGGRLALSADGLLFGTSHPFGAGAATPEGIKTATLGPAFPVVWTDRSYVRIDGNDRSADALVVCYKLVPRSAVPTGATLTISDEENAAALYAARVTATAQAACSTLPSGLWLPPRPERVTFEIRNPDGTRSNTVSRGASDTLSPVAEAAPRDSAALSGPWLEVRERHLRLPMPRGEAGVVTVAGWQFPKVQPGREHPAGFTAGFAGGAVLWATVDGEISEALGSVTAVGETRIALPLRLWVQRNVTAVLSTEGPGGPRTAMRSIPRVRAVVSHVRVAIPEAPSVDALAFDGGVNGLPDPSAAATDWIRSTVPTDLQIVDWPFGPDRVKVEPLRKTSERVVRVFYASLPKKPDGSVSDFSIDLEAVLAPGSIPTSDAGGSWTKLSGPQSGAFDRPTGLKVKYRNAREPGLYRFAFQITPVAPMTEVAVLLPAAGGEISDWFREELRQMPGRALRWLQHWDAQYCKVDPAYCIPIGEEGVFQSLRTLWARAMHNDERLELQRLADGYAAASGFDYQGLALAETQQAPTRRYSWAAADRMVLGQADAWPYNDELEVKNFNDWDSPSYVTLNGVVLLRGKLNLMLGTVFFRLLRYQGWEVKQFARLDQFRRAFLDDSPSAQAAIQLGSDLFDAGLDPAVATSSRLRALQDPERLNDGNLWPSMSLYVPQPNPDFPLTLRFQERIFNATPETVACGPFSNTSGGLGFSETACQKWGRR